MNIAHPPPIQSHTDSTAAPPAPSTTAPPPARLGGLSGKLLLLTILFVMLAEVLVFVPSIANFRINWLTDRLNVADVAALAMESASELPRDLQDQLLSKTGAITIAVREDGKRRLVAMKEMPPEIDAHVSLHQMTFVTAIGDAFRSLIAGEGRVLLVKGRVPPSPNRSGERYVEVVLPEADLRAALFTYSRNILILSLIISLIAAMMVYMALRWLIVRPLQKLREAMTAFAHNPEDPTLMTTPSGRRDEIGEAEARFAELQRDLVQLIGQQRHLADLGLAVSKINHDLRNILAAAQLFTERLSMVPDSTVQRLAPKLIASLDRALGYSQAVLSYGKAREAPPQRRLIVLQRLVDDVAQTLGLPQHPTIQFEADLHPLLELDADPDQLFRVLLNLSRNAMQALDARDDPHLVRRLTIGARRTGASVTIEVADTGPGLPARARENLFKAFQGSTRPGGTGLGLAIAAELVRGHGGTIDLVGPGPGATFRIVIPDRTRTGG